jgi:hypothetical protein
MTVFFKVPKMTKEEMKEKGKKEKKPSYLPCLHRINPKPAC